MALALLCTIGLPPMSITPWILFSNISPQSCFPSRPTRLDFFFHRGACRLSSSITKSTLRMLLSMWTCNMNRNNILAWSNRTSPMGHCYISNRTSRLLVLQDHEVFQRVCPAKHRTLGGGLFTIVLSSGNPDE